MKLGLGTVQFGLDYGISNRNGQTSMNEVVRILAYASANDVSVLDTAALYGESEEVLGKVLSGENRTPFKIVTKTPGFRKAILTEKDADVLEQTFLDSLKKLHRPSVYGLLLHDCDDAKTPGSEIILERMKQLRSRGLVQKIGVSAYNPVQVDRVMERTSIDIVQVPFNVLDQRFQRSGCFSRLKNRGVEIHTRSAFLQGALLADPTSLPPHFAPHLWRFERFHAVSAAAGLTPLAAALGFVLNRQEVDCCVIGVSTCSELTEVLQAEARHACHIDFTEVSSEDEALINPSQWGGAQQRS